MNRFPTACCTTSMFLHQGYAHIGFNMLSLSTRPRWGPHA
ncbi:rhomboid family intramembrane serine protease [Streptomyces sp. NPDC048491]